VHFVSATHILHDRRHVKLSRAGRIPLQVLCLLQIVPISIPDMDAARVSHIYTFGSEAVSCHTQELQTPALKCQMAADVRITLGIAQSFKAQQFVQAQRIRARMVTYMEKVFDAVDFVATPTIPDAAPHIRSACIAACQCITLEITANAGEVLLSMPDQWPATCICASKLGQLHGHCDWVGGLLCVLRKAVWHSGQVQCVFCCHEARSGHVGLHT